VQLIVHEIVLLWFLEVLVVFAIFKFSGKDLFAEFGAIGFGVIGFRV
jgi:hypothetical protein